MADQDPHTPTPAPRRRLLRALLWMAASAVLAVGAVLAVATAALPLLEQRPELVAGWIEGHLGRQVRIRQMDLTWQGSSPVVQLHGLEFDTRNPSAPTVAMDLVEVRVDALGSLRAGALRPHSVIVRGADFELDRDSRGVITLVGFGLSNAAPADDVFGALMASLPEGAVFGVEKARVALRGFQPPGAGMPDMLLEAVSLDLRADAQGLRLSGAVARTDDPSAALRFTLRWMDPARSPLESADLTLSTRALSIATLPPGLIPPALSGTLDLDLDGRLLEGAVVAMRGTAMLRDARLRTAATDLRRESAQSLVEFRRDGRDWTLTLLRLQSRQAGRLSTPATLSVTRDAAAPEGEYRVEVDHAPLATLLAIAPEAGPGSTLARLLAGVRPAGSAQDLRVQVTLGPDAIRVVGLSAALRDVVAIGPGGRTRLGPANLQLEAREGSGRVTLAPSPMSIDTPNGEALPFAAGGEARWQLDGDALRVRSTGINLASGTSRLRLEGALVLPVDDGASPHLHITGRGGGFDAGWIRRHMGLAHPSEELGEWLQRSIRQGRVGELELEARGTLDELATLGGTLRAKASFEDTTLEYEAGWPALEKLSGDITLDGTRFTIDVSGGSVSGASIDGAHGEVVDVTQDDLHVALKGRVRGLIQQGADFIAKSPLGARFAGLLGQLDARGRGTLDLALDIPLGPASTRVDGTVTVSDNTLKVGALRSALEKVSGRIRFDQEGLREGTLEARYLERPIAARMDGTLADRTRTRLTIDGAADPEGLVRHLYDVGALDSDETHPRPLLSRLAGTSNWQVTLDMAHDRPLDGEGIALSVRSDLQGMALELPAPLGKTAAANRLLRIDTHLTESGPRLVRIRYGDDMSAVLEHARESKDTFRLGRGEVRFGGEPASLPESEGLRVTGRIALLSVDDWVALIADAAATGEAPDPDVEGDQPLARVERVDVEATRLVALGAGFDEVKVRVTREASGTLRVEAKGGSVDGVISVPVPVGSAAIQARFTNLVVHPGSRVTVPGGNATRHMDPRGLPEARIVAERLAYGDIELGLAKLIIRRSAQGVEMSELFTLNENFELRGSGSWTDEGDDARSKLSLRIHSADFGRLSQVLGYGDSGVESGVSDIAIDAGWKGTPFDFGLDRIQGVLHFRASDGRLRDVEPSATGRVFGLLNVAVLPRRLLYLDFNDLFEEGIRYKLAEGSFRLDAGNAWSDNFSMHTESARIDLAGRVGLVAEDYDQVMTVTPKLSASLPLAPLWLAEKFLNRKLIDSAFAYRYIITGKWDDPKVERIRVKAERTDAG